MNDGQDVAQETPDPDYEIENASTGVFKPIYAKTLEEMYHRACDIARETLVLAVFDVIAGVHIYVYVGNQTKRLFRVREVVS